MTVRGRKSGEPRTVALLYLADGDDVVVVASLGGMSKHPVWYLNLEANPDVTLQIGAERREMIARGVSDEEKATLWPRPQRCTATTTTTRDARRETSR